MTVQILQLQEHQEKFRNNVKTKVMLKELIEKRKRLLKILRDQDYPRFEFLLKRLNIVYHPFQEWVIWIFVNLFHTKKKFNLVTNIIFKLLVVEIIQGPFENIAPGGSYKSIVMN